MFQQIALFLLSFGKLLNVKLNFGDRKCKIRRKVYDIWSKTLFLTLNSLVYRVTDIGCSNLSEICDRRNMENGVFRRSTKTTPPGTPETGVNVKRKKIS